MEDGQRMEYGSFCFAGTAVVMIVVTNCSVHFNVDVALVAGQS